MTSQQLTELDPVQGEALRLLKRSQNNDMRFSLSRYVGIPCTLNDLELRFREPRDSKKMRIVRVLHENRKLVAVGLLGLLALTTGCDGSGGESNVAPATPPPGASAQEISDAMKKAYGPTGIPKTTKSFHKTK
jgi:hypothetical protein